MPWGGVQLPLGLRMESRLWVRTQLTEGRAALAGVGPNGRGLRARVRGVFSNLPVACRLRESLNPTWPSRAPAASRARAVGEGSAMARPPGCLQVARAQPATGKRHCLANRLGWGPLRALPASCPRPPRRCRLDGSEARPSYPRLIMRSAQGRVACSPPPPNRGAVRQGGGRGVDKRQSCAGPRERRSAPIRK